MAHYYTRDKFAAIYIALNLMLSCLFNLLDKILSADSLKYRPTAVRIN